MSGINLTIQAEKLDTLRADIEKLEGAVTGPDIALVMGRALRDIIQDHFAEIAQDEAHHQSARSLGATSTGFYEKARENTQAPQLENGGVSVSIDMEGLAQRIFGGTISAKPGGFLTIPARTETYGHRAREFDNLKLIVFGGTKLAALVDKSAPADEGSVYYWLVRSVTQAPDPTVLPTETEMVDSAMEAAREYLDLAWQRAAPTS